VKKEAHRKAAAWTEAAMAVEERGRLVAAARNAGDNTRAIATHMIEVVAPSLRRRAEIIKRKR
jgi:hypothetical protein